MTTITRARDFRMGETTTPRSAAAFRLNRRVARRRPGGSTWLVPAAGLILDAVIVLCVTALVSMAFRQKMPAANDISFGLQIAALFVVANASQRIYSVRAYLHGTRQVRHVALAWCIAFMAAITIGFLTKTSDHYSRWTAVSVFVSGLTPIAVARLAMAEAMLRLARNGRIAARRIFLVGHEEPVQSFAKGHDFRSLGIDVAGGAIIRNDQDCIGSDLALAVATARILRPEDIYILATKLDGTFLGQCVNAFALLPAAIHIGPDVLLGQFADMQIVRDGSITSVHLIRNPLSPVGAFVKRSFDLVVATLALVVLSPLLLMVAAIVRLDSPGAALFRQTRIGFNREPFTIFKFRSMRVLENGVTIKQATRGDARITRVGHWLRRTNIDELPQLLNVILGHMSLVGPRPHAMAHDQSFEPAVPQYARRQNVRPGITGWAQVHGWRGETNTADKLEARITHDLHYVDNWSFTLDLWILARTMLSPLAYRNAH